MAEADRAKRPSLGHVLLLITCCAVYFALARRFLDPAQRDVPLPDILLLSLLSIVTGVCWAAMLIVFYRKTRGSRVITEPGDWLMFCIGIVEAINIVSQLLPDNFIIHKNSLPVAAQGIVFVIPMLSRRLPPNWKLFFGILVLASQIPLVAALAIAHGALPEKNPTVQISRTAQPYVVLASLAIVLYLDHRAGRHHGWSHWLGVASLMIWMFL